MSNFVRTAGFIVSEYLNNTSKLFKLFMVFLCCIAILFFLIDLYSMPDRKYIIDLLDNHKAAPLLNYFARSLITFMLAVFFAILLIIINTVGFIHMMLVSGNGHIIFLCISSTAALISLLIYCLEPESKNRETFGIVGTGMLSYSFGFLCGFKLVGAKVDESDK